jgi:hypothetical protein
VGAAADVAPGADSRPRQVVAQFFIMQPGMGAGIAASKTPSPAQARLRSIINHTVFGFGLYISAVLTAMLVAVG